MMIKFKKQKIKPKIQSLKKKKKKKISYTNEYEYSFILFKRNFHSMDKILLNKFQFEWNRPFVRSLFFCSFPFFPFSLFNSSFSFIFIALQMDL